MKKAFDQTVRDIKREVNKKVLKVPSIEQKVLDATSNEPWGPHGLLLADIAQATRNFHECQIIMGVVWKRINDTGRNWRHVYKALTVLEYLVANGSERVIDEIKEHGYQISTLSNFQYIDSSGRDQGNNVRKKSQSLVVLVNDKERIQEVRQKAAANRDKYRNSSMGSRYQPGSYSKSGGYGDRYDDDNYDSRYGYRDDDRSGYGRERDLGYRDDRYAKYGDSYSRDGDKYGRDYEDRYGQDGYRDDVYRGRSQSNDDYSNGPRSRSADRDKDRAYDDDGNYSSRGSGVKADDHPQNESTTIPRSDPGYSEQNPAPSYEDAVSATRSPTYTDREVESSVTSAPKAIPPPVGASSSNATVAAPPVVHVTRAATPAPDASGDGFDEFDPRSTFSVARTTTNGMTPASSLDIENDLLDTLSESYSSNSLALVPVTQSSVNPETMTEANISSGPTFLGTSSASSATNQPFGDPFGDGPFKAIPTTYSAQALPQHHASTISFPRSSSEIFGEQHPGPKEGTEIGNSYDNSYKMSSGPSNAQSPINLQPVPKDSSILTHNFDILPPQTRQYVSPDALQHQTNQPQTGPPTHSMPLTFPAQAGQPLPSQMSFHPQNGQPTFLGVLPSQMGSLHAGFQAPLGGQFTQPNPQNPNFYSNDQSQVLSIGSDVSNVVPSGSSGSVGQNNFQSQIGSAVPATSLMGPHAPQVQPSSTLSPVPSSIGSAMQTSNNLASPLPQPSKDKFETKSSVWADTLSRGLVNLNISGSKTNPLADIGVDFDAINRKEKRMEKPTTATVTSTVTMGKAMGSGSGIGRAGVTALRPPLNPAMGSAMNTNIIGGSYGINQPVGRGMGMRMNMNMGIGQGINMQPPAGFPTGSTVPGGYNPMMGMGNYSQQQYGGGQ